MGLGRLLNDQFYPLVLTEVFGSQKHQGDPNEVRQQQMNQLEPDGGEQSDVERSRH